MPAKSTSAARWLLGLVIAAVLVFALYATGKGGSAQETQDRQVYRITCERSLPDAADRAHCAKMRDAFALKYGEQP